MFKKTMQFDDLDGNEVTQTFYFNYNKKEVAELIEFKDLEGMLKRLQTPVEESGLSQRENNQMAYDAFQDLILDAYGEKGADNVTFVKNEKLREYFRNHVAYVEMIFEFLGDPDLASSFVENCLPAKLVAKAKEEMQADAQNKLTSATLSGMVEEAERRQQDPETRVGPGNAPDLSPVPDLEEKVSQINEESEANAKAHPVKFDYENMTADQVREMSDEDFKKLDIRKLSKDAMFAAFSRKS